MPVAFSLAVNYCATARFLRQATFRWPIPSTTRAYAVQLKIDLTEGAARRLRSLPLFSPGIRLNTAHNASRLGVVGREVIRNKRCGSL
jgi:hypothetical protein